MSENQGSTPNAAQGAQPTAPAAEETKFQHAYGIRGQAAAQRAETREKGQPRESAPETPEGGDRAAEEKPKSAISEAAKEAMRRHRVKVNGEELEVDEDELKRGYSHAKAAAQKMQQAQIATKRAEMALEMLRDPQKFWEIAQRLGHDPRKLSEERLSTLLEEEMLTPEEREARDMRAKLREYEELEKRQREAIEKKRLDEVKSRYMKEYETEFVSALEESKLPKTKGMVAEMARYIHNAAKIGYKLSAGEAARLVRDDVNQKLKSFIGDSDGEVLLKLLGDDVANKVRKYDTSRLKDPNRFAKTPEQAPEHRERNVQAPTKRMSSAEWQRFKRGLK